MRKAPSFDELKESSYFYISLTPYSFNFNETVEVSDNSVKANSFVYFHCNVNDISEPQKLNLGRDIRVNLQEREFDATSKYPLGYVQFFDDSVSITLMCRESLITKVSSLTGLSSEIFITLPSLPDQRPSLFPVLNYQVRVESNT